MGITLIQTRNDHKINKNNNSITHWGNQSLKMKIKKKNNKNNKTSTNNNKKMNKDRPLNSNKIIKTSKYHKINKFKNNKKIKNIINHKLRMTLISKQIWNYHLSIMPA